MRAVIFVAASLSSTQASWTADEDYTLVMIMMGGRGLLTLDRNEPYPTVDRIYANPFLSLAAHWATTPVAVDVDFQLNKGDIIYFTPGGESGNRTWILFLEPISAEIPA